MNKFKEAIAKIDDRIAKQAADVSRMAELAVAKFDKLAAARKELVQNVRMIFDRECSSDFVFDDAGVTWEIDDINTFIQITRDRDGDKDIVEPYVDAKFVDIHTLSDLQIAMRLLDRMTEENKRIEEVLNAYVHKLDVRADRADRIIDKLESDDDEGYW